MDHINHTPPEGGSRVHPLHFMQTLRKLIGNDVTVTSDVGTVGVWMTRYFPTFEPNRLLFANGQQPLGVGLPYGIAACFVHPHEKVVSISGDGAFLYSAMELNTAVRHKLNLVHFVWTDNAYNMVAIQEQAKYGRTAAVDIGSIDTVRHAESYGAVGLKVNSPAELESVMKKALNITGPVVVDIPIDYSENMMLLETLHSDLFH